MKTGNETIRRNRHFLKPKEQSVVSKVPSEVTKEQSVAAPPVRKGNSPTLPDPEPQISTDPVTVVSPDPLSDISPDTVPATPTKCTRTRVVKPPNRFKDFVS